MELVADSGAVVVSSADAWTYIRPGEITVVDPSSGQVGTRVTVTGISLCGSGTSIVQVTLAGLEATLVSQTACSLVRCYCALL